MRRDDPSLEGMGSFGKIRTLADLPSKGEFARLAREAMKLTDEGVKAPPRPKKARVTLVVPPDLQSALARNNKARAAFDTFSYSHRKEYLDWISEAKRDATRAARVKQAIAWMAEGKSRHWKYLE
jgi:uncharacterized protein YdeI (YjbR/CyaY-like superfamily)